MTSVQPPESTANPAHDGSPDVQLRPIEDGDLPILFTQQLDHDAILMAAFTAKDPTDRDAFMAHWAKIRADPGITIRAILCDDELAGSILSHAWFGDLEISYWLGKSFWGRGVATQALAAFLLAQQTRPIYGRAAKDNLGSIRVMQKCGFRIIAEEIGYAQARNAEIAELLLCLG